MAQEIHGHQKVVKDSIEIRGEVRETLYCERCHHHIDRDSPEEFADVDCDQYAELVEKMTGSMNEVLSG